MTLDSVEVLRKKNPVKVYCLAPEYWGVPDELLYSSNPFILGMKLKRMDADVWSNKEVVKRLFNLYGNFQKYEKLLPFTPFQYTNGAHELHVRHHLLAEILGYENTRKYLGGATMQFNSLKDIVFGNLLTLQEFNALHGDMFNLYHFLREFPPFQRDRELLKKLEVNHAISLYC